MHLFLPGCMRVRWNAGLGGFHIGTEPSVSFRVCRARDQVVDLRFSTTVPGLKPYGEDESHDAGPVEQGCWPSQEAPGGLGGRGQNANRHNNNRQENCATDQSYGLKGHTLRSLPRYPIIESLVVSEGIVPCFMRRNETFRWPCSAVKDADTADRHKSKQSE